MRSANHRRLGSQPIPRHPDGPVLEATALPITRSSRQFGELPAATKRATESRDHHVVGFARGFLTTDVAASPFVRGSMRCAHPRTSALSNLADRNGHHRPL